MSFLAFVVMAFLDHSYDRRISRLNADTLVDNVIHMSTIGCVPAQSEEGTAAALLHMKAQS